MEEIFTNIVREMSQSRESAAISQNNLLLYKITNICVQEIITSISKEMSSFFGIPSEIAKKYSVTQNNHYLRAG